MKELAKKFIDKECVISSFDGSHQYEGVIKEENAPKEFFENPQDERLKEFLSKVL